MAVSLGGGALGVAPIIEFELGCTLRTEGGRVVIAARTSDEPGPFRVNDVIKSINGYSITSEDHAKSVIQGAVGDVLTVELVRGGGTPATAVCFRGSTRSDFIAAVRSANLERAKSILADLVQPASRAVLCQVQAPDEDGKLVPLLKLACQTRSESIARYLLGNGAVQNIYAFYTHQDGQFETNVCGEPWYSAGMVPIIRDCIHSEFIAAVRSANLGKVKAILGCIKSEASRAVLCQVQAPDEDGKLVPLLKLAADLGFILIVRRLLHNGAIQSILDLYSDDESQFETNVRDAGFICQGLNLAPFIRECILFRHGESLPDDSLKSIVQEVGLGTVSVTRDTILIAAVKKSAVFAKKILDMDPFSSIR